VKIIQRRTGWIPIDWAELVEYRELLLFLTWRDIKVRYKQTVLGVAWTVLQPVLTMVVFSVLFGQIAQIPTEGLPYPVFVYAALLPWTFFANGINLSGTSLVNSAHLITKIYFPRVLVPCASIGAGLIDLFVSFGVLACLMLYYGVAPPVLVLLTPVLIVLTVAAALGVGFWLSALSVGYRDFRYVIPFLVQIWMFCSPVIYPVSFVPERWQWLLALNPMTGIISGYRGALLGQAMSWGQLGVSAAATALVFGGGLAYFRRVERRFADIA
jgi:lipopolysaccharide transport system permease protein